MLKRGIVLGVLAIAWGCGGPSGVASRTLSDANAKKLVFLTRGGCVNTATMRANLDDAMRAFGSAASYEVLDLDTLSETDARRGYPTPTLLYENRDVFGLLEPQPPFPDPT